MFTVKRFFFLTAVFLAVFVLFSQEARAEKNIGILVWSEETRYIETQRGIMEQLKKDGFSEPQVKFTIENAKASKVKATELAQKFAASKMDMVIALGTSAAVPAAKEIKDIPVIFGMVYDPVESKIARDWNSSGNNTTGSSSKVPMSQLVTNLKKLRDVKKLGVLYTAGEKNSEAQLKEIQGLQSELQFRVIPVPLAKKEDVNMVISEVVGAVDAIYLSGSSIIADAIPMIVELTSKAKVITVTHLEDIVEKGVLLGVCADSYAVGRLAGEKAVKVLKGAKPSSVPIEPLKKLDVIVNMKTAQASQIAVSSEFKKIVTRTIN